MDIQYHKWLEVEVTHNYFPDGVGSVFTLIPFDGSSRSMGNYEVRLNSQQNLYSFYVGIDDADNLDLASHLHGLGDLYFQLIVTDPLFFNYTNLEFTPEGNPFFLSSANNASGAYTMHSDSFVSEKDLLPIRPSRFIYSIPEGDTLVEVKSTDGAILTSEELSSPGDLNYLIDLNQQDNGVYELWLNNQIAEKFFLSQQSLQPGCVGVVQLSIESILDKNDPNLKYQIHFNARSVYWRYKIVIPTDRNMEILEMSITGSSNEIYEGPVEEAFMGDQKTSVFTSNIATPLKQKLETTPVLQVSYTNNFSNSNSELELKLPNPGAESLTKNVNEQNEESFYSSSIIYV